MNSTIPAQYEDDYLLFDVQSDNGLIRVKYDPEGDVPVWRGSKKSLLSHYEGKPTKYFHEYRYIITLSPVYVLPKFNISWVSYSNLLVAIVKSDKPDVLEIPDNIFRAAIPDYKYGDEVLHVSGPITPRVVSPILVSSFLTNCDVRLATDKPFDESETFSSLFDYAQSHKMDLDIMIRRVYESIPQPYRDFHKSIEEQALDYWKEYRSFL